MIATDINGISAFLNSLDSGKVYCFRGQASSTWGLVPSLYRRPKGTKRSIGRADGDWIGRAERDVYRDFRRHASGQIKLDDWWDVLCVAQHYGCPTRLLDWTRNILVAAFFAVLRVDNDSKSSAIWCLNLSDFPFHPGLMRPVPKGGYRFENLKSYSGGFKPSFFQEVSSPIRVTRSGHGLPEATLSVFEAPSIVPRIESQDSLFSIYLSYYDSDLVTDQARIARAAEKKANVKLLTKLEIPHGAAEKVRTDLGRIGMNNFKLFPDLVGLGAYMKEEHLQSVIDNLL